MINIRMQPKEVKQLSPKITVIGVGGAGGNAVNNMISSNLEGVEFLVCNTDSQALEQSLADNRLQLGVAVTGGLGAGARPEVGEAAAEESLDDVMAYLEGSNMAFITAGMGGGTGTGGAPVIAKHCREKGILTVGVVTKPFHFEGNLRMKMAEEGIRQMQDYVDTLIVIPNQNLFRVANEKTTFSEAFKMADSVLQSGVRGVTDLMVMPGLINLDFADIRSVMLEMGKAMMGTGEASGDKRAIEAAEAAINNPLLDDVSMKGANGVIINVTGGYDMTLFEADEACNRIRDEVDPNANIIFGSTFDETMDGLMRVSIVATGIDTVEKKKTKPLGGVTFERATPRTDANAKSEEDEDSSSSSSSSSSSGSFAPVRMNKVKEADMFRQQDFAQPAMDLSSLTTKPDIPETLIRGERYKDGFIPPVPSMPSAPPPVSAQPVPAVAAMAASVSTPAPVSGYSGDMSLSISGQSRQQVESGLGPRLPSSSSMPSAPLSAPVHAPVQTTMHPGPSGLSLKPPVPGASSQRRKTPSLFERITGHGRKDESQTQTVETSGRSDIQQKPSQPSLSIDGPAKPASQHGESELDIPAFLRRQAN